MNKLLDINRNGMLVDEKSGSIYCVWNDNTFRSENNKRKKQCTEFKR